MINNINRGRTNILDVKFLSQYEKIQENIVLLGLNQKPEEFLKLFFGKKYSILDARISESGMIQNFKIRYENTLNEYNVLNYGGSTFLPKEFRDFEVHENYIYTIRFWSARKIPVTEDMVESLVEDNQMVIGEDNNYWHIMLGDSIETHWVEDPYKAIFFLKSLGFYIGANDPNHKENIKIIKEYGSEDEILMSSLEPVIIDNITSSIAIITKRKISWNLSDSIQFRFREYQKKTPRKINPMNKLKVQESDLEPDQIDPRIDKLKTPRRLPKQESPETGPERVLEILKELNLK